MRVRHKEKSLDFSATFGGLRLKQNASGVPISQSTFVSCLDKKMSSHWHQICGYAGELLGSGDVRLVASNPLEVVTLMRMSFVIWPSLLRNFTNFLRYLAKIFMRRRVWSYQQENVKDVRGRNSWIRAHGRRGQRSLGRGWQAWAPYRI